MKKLYIILAILLFVLIGAGGTAYYFLNVKTYDLSQDHELAKLAGEGYELVLPKEDDNDDKEIGIEDADDDTTTVSENTSDGSSQDKETEPQLNETTNDAQNYENDTIGSSSSQGNKSTSSNKVTAASVKEKYRPSFESLETQANSKINALVGRAIAEYKEKRANGEEISYSYFLTKYKTAGEALEAKTDQAFEQVYAALQRELKAKGFDPNEAKDVRTTYDAMKKQRRNALLTRAMENL